jgi:hypothetical protein
MTREELFIQFESNQHLTRLHHEGMGNIDLIYASTEQIFAISFFQDASILEAKWEDAAEELAVHVQSRLTGSYDAFRWDMYLILFVEASTVPVELKVSIENNRYFFRKMVIESNKPADQNKLPIAINRPSINSDEKGFLFEQRDFLQQLKTTLPNDIIQHLDDSLFEQDDLNTEKLLAYIEKVKV